MRVSVFGAGYVGLVTATCLASVGHSVICVDVDRRRVLDLSRGNPVN
jgi:UDPglucose 6-dehydrogenase